MEHKKLVQKLIPPFMKFHVAMYKLK